MNPYQVMFMLLTFVGFVAVLPAWTHIQYTATQGLPVHTAWLATLALPVTVMLYLTSWLQPGGA